MSESKDNAERYLEAFDRLEARINEISGLGIEKYFTDRLAAAAQVNRLVRNHAVEINEFHDLCTGIICRNERHERIILAEPNSMMVEGVSRMADLISRHFNVMDFATHPVQTVGPEEKVTEVFRKMNEIHTSKMPVYQDGRYAGFVTMESMTQWCVDGCSPDTAVKEVLANATKHDMVLFLSQDRDAQDALMGFQDSMKKGSNLLAVLITEKGNVTEPVLGIITVFDIPKIFAAYN